MRDTVPCQSTKPFVCLVVQVTHPREVAERWPAKTVNDAVGPCRLRHDLVCPFYRAPHVQTVRRQWDEKDDYSHFVVLHCASHPVMPSAGHSPLTERSQECLPVAARGTFRALLDAVMDLRCLQLPHHRCHVGHDHWIAEVLWHDGCRTRRTRYLPGAVGLSLNRRASGARAPRTATAVNLSDSAPFRCGTPSRRA